MTIIRILSPPRVVPRNIIQWGKRFRSPTGSFTRHHIVDNRKSGFVRRRRYEVQAHFYTGTFPVHLCEPGRCARVVEFPGCWPESVIQPRYERRRNGFPELYLHRQPDGWLKPLWLRRSSSDRPELWFECLRASPPRDIDSQHPRPVEPYRCGGDPRTAERSGRTP